jgi:hypothetical protein
MLARRARLWFKIISIPTLGFLMVSLWLPCSTRLDAQTSTSQGSKMRDLQEQRLATLRNLVEITTEHYKNGQVSSDEVQAAARARDEAELDLCTSNAQRIAVLERIVQEARTIEEEDARLMTNNLISRRLWLKAKADRLQQQIRLEYAKTK